MPSQMNRHTLFSLSSLLCLLVAVFACILEECDGLTTNIITHRAVAVFALMESMKRNQKFAIRVLEQDPAYLNLDQRDRAFARNLLSTTERRMGQIDQVIKSFAHKKEDKKKNTKIRPHDILCEAALRIGATQILFLDVPTYAAVSETVEALKNHPKVKVSKAQISYVNAVLRNIDREGKSRLDATSTLANVDTWLADQWIQTYGKETTEKMVGAAMSQSPVFITVNHNHQDNSETKQQDTIIDRSESIRDVFTSIADEEEDDDDDDDFEQVEAEAELLPIGSIRIPANVGGSVSKWPLYDDGAWWVQDVSATLPAIALFNSLCINGGKQPEDIHVVDLCSAPGGKTAQLCSMGFGKVDAVEISKRRSRSLHQNLKRLGMDKLCNVCVEDGTKFQPHISENDDVVQGVLVDAPCSATGLGSRRPDVLRKSINLDELISIQRELVVHAANNILDVGGVLVYATCSLLKQEGEDQVDWLLSQDVPGKDENTELLSSTLETIPFELGEIPGFDDCIDENGWLRVIPGVLPGSLQFCDGFFVARMRKIA